MSRRTISPTSPPPASRPTRWCSKKLTTPTPTPRKIRSDIRFVRDIGLMRDMRQGAIAMTGNPLDVAHRRRRLLHGARPDRAALHARRRVHAFRRGPARDQRTGARCSIPAAAPIVFDPQGETPLDRTRRRDHAWPALKSAASAWRRSPRRARSKRSATTFGTRRARRRANSKACVVQGALEGSNVRPVIELTRLIEISRAYQSAARIVSGADDLRQRAIERLGRAA